VRLETIEERNEARIDDLLIIREALLYYRQEEGEFPSTDGRLQSLCTYIDLDAGCDLDSVLNSIPRDPGDDEYAYQSDGETFTVGARWEGDEEPSDELNCPFAMTPEEGRRVCVNEATNTASLAGEPTVEPTTRPTDSTDSAGVSGTPEERNKQRLADLAEVRDALLAFRDDEGTFPSTGGRVQTLCTYVDVDLGCRLEQVMGEIPHDPAGANSGYYYASDGNTFAVAAIWEGDAAPDGFGCPAAVDPLRDQGTPVCITQED
jgi:hypothetical protein